MANVTKTTRIQAMQSCRNEKQKSRIGYRTDNRRILQQLAANSFTEDEWKKIIQKMDEII